jgi:hypothetical protein
MTRATGKDHARINLDIWGDEDWLDLAPRAQHLYFVLWTSPQLSYCGTGEWRPAKIAAKAKGWTPVQVEAAAAELSERLFLIIDTDTEEFLLRSWAKHDGLWRTPNMAVSMANARADLASRKLRGVFVFEVLKLKKRNADSNSWSRDAVATMLTQKAVDPATLTPFTPSITPPLTPVSTPSITPPLTPLSTLSAGVGVNPTSNPGATPAPAPTSSSILQGGHQNPEGHQGAEHDSNTPPPQFCKEHPNGTGTPSRACGAAGDRRRAWIAARTEARLREIADCPSCDPKGWLLNDDGTPADRQVRCPAHTWEAVHA